MEKTLFKIGKKEWEKVESALEELQETCQMLGVPMFATVATENTENQTVYNTIVNGAGSHNMKLTDDRICRHILIANGFEIIKDSENQIIVVPPKDKKRMHVKSSFKVDKNEG